jgi:nitroreductase
VVVKDPEKKKMLAAVHPFAKMVGEAPVVIIVCGDPSLEKFSGYWMQDCSAATQNLLLAAHSLGLGAVWTGIFPEGERVQKIQEILKIPGGVFPFSMIPIGYPLNRSPAESRLSPERVHEDTW